ncbi:MAG: hypothetical protein ABIQ44_08800 [Chloroflexia bacterium]
MRAYTVATVALTLGVTPKWLDNALSRFPVRGVLRTRQGVSRRLAPQAVVTLHLANELIRTLGLPLGTAISLAERAGEAEETAAIELFPSARLVVQISAAARDVNARLAHAVEVTPVPKRGRPSTK